MRWWKSKNGALSCQCPDELTPEAHSLWGHTALPGHEQSDEKTQVNETEEGEEPRYPRLQLGDVDRSAPHKAHKHTGFNVLVNAVPIPSCPSSTFSAVREILKM